MKINYTNLTFTELVNKIGSSRFFDLPSMLKEIFTRLTPQAPKYKVYTATLRFSRTGSDISTYALENTIGDITISRINNSIVFESPQFETGNVYVVPSTLKSYNGSVVCFGELCNLQKDSFTFTDSIKRTPGLYNFPNGVWFQIDSTLFDGMHNSYIQLFTNVEIRVYN